MKTTDLKSLNKTIAEVSASSGEKLDILQDLQEGFMNSLTEKAYQVYSPINEEKDEDEGEKEESPAEEKAEDKAEMLMKRLAAKALKRARKKAATNEEVELAEKAAPGYEDWASDPKVKASFKKQYGNRWKEVMYGHSWNLAKQEKKLNESEQLDEISDTLLFRARAKAMGVGKFKVRKNPSFAGSSKDVPLHKKITKELQNRGSVPIGEETELDEGYQAKRIRIMRKHGTEGSLLSPKLDDYMKRSFKKKRQRDERISGGRGSAKAFEIRAAKKKAAMQAEGLAEEWGGGFQSYQDAHREVQAGLRREASINRRKLVADIKAVHSGKMTPAAFTRKHKTKFSELPLAKKMAASRAKAKARYLAKKAAKASAPKADSAPSIMEGMELNELSKGVLGRYIKKATTDITRTMQHPYPTSGHPDPEVAHDNFVSQQDEIGRKVGRRERGIRAATDRLVKEAMQLDEAGYKRLMRLKKAAYKSGLMGSASYGKKMRAAAEREAQVGARMASRGGASPEAVKGGGSTIGKSGKPTMTAARLATVRDKGLARFRSTAKIARYSETGNFDGKLSKEGVAKKRAMQQGRAKFAKQVQTGDFGPVDYNARKSQMRAQLNYEKRFGRLKGK